MQFTIDSLSDVIDKDVGNVFDVDLGGLQPSLDICTLHHGGLVKGIPDGNHCSIIDHCKWHKWSAHIVTGHRV